MADKVFISGPLMGGSDLADELKHYQFLTYIGRGKTPGKMYNVGDYPGAVPTDAPRMYLYGDMYECNSEDALQMLDEGAGAVGDDPTLHHFRRDLRPVTLENGRLEQAWVFFYNMSVAGLPLIPSGDYQFHKTEEKKLSRRGFFTRLFPKLD